MHRNPPLILTTYVVVSLAGTFVAASLAMDTPAEVDNLAIESRAQIRSGHVTLEIDGQSNGRSYSIHCETWFDGPKLRCDVTDGEAQALRGDTPLGSVSSSVVLTGDQVIRVDHRTPKDGGAYVITLDDFPADGDRAKLIECPIDPRLLGMIPLDITMASMHFTGRDFVGGEGASDHRVETSQLGHAVRHESSDVIREYLVIPEKGHAVERIASRHTSSAGIIADEAVSELAVFGTQAVWFPRLVDYKRHEGDLITRSEIVRVTDAEFNVDIPSEVFTLAGMKAPVGGTVVVNHGSDPTISEVGIWDGKAIQPTEFVDPPLVSAERDNRRIALLIVTAAATAWLAFLVLRKGRRQPDH